MANTNEFNVIKYKGTERDTLSVISKDEPGGTARFSFDTLNTEEGFLIIDLKNIAAGTKLIVEISGSPAMLEGVQAVHFVQQDPSDLTVSNRAVIFETVTDNGGVFIPITYSKVMEKIVVDIEVTGANQETVLNIGADISSQR